MEQKSSFDKTQIAGIVLIGVILIAFSFFNGGKDKPETNPATTDTIQTPAAAVQPATTTDEIATADIDTLKGIQQKEEIYTIQNDLVEIRISSKGAQMEAVRLKEFLTYDSLPLYIFNNNQSMDFAFGGWNSGDAWFVPVERTATSLALQTNGPDGNFTIRWELKPGDYQARMSVSGSSASRQPLSVDWQHTALRHEKSLKNENQQTSTYFWEIEDDDYSDLSSSGSDKDEASNIRWVAHKQQFFSAILTSDVRFDKAGIEIEETGNDSTTKHMHSRVQMQNVEGNFTVPFSLYLGPNEYKILKEYEGLNYDELIPFGWGIFGWISRGVVVQIFMWLEGYGLNYGIIILLMTVMIKLVLFPLTFTSYRSMAKMRVLKPEIDEINEEYKDQDPVKKQQAVMGLYRKVGVNPIGGCIPQLLQMPILLSMFYFFPASIELRQQPFLWAKDLSSYDSIASIPSIPFYGDHISLFTILMAISMFLYTYMNQQMTGSNSQMPQLKWIMYLMPVMLLVWFNSYASGLSYYYLLSNLITFGQMFVIRAFIDEDALHAKLQANKTKERKKSKFQARLDRAMEQQKDAQVTNRQMRRRSGR